MDKRVYGVLGISAIMANWNADFSLSPKMTGKGNIYGSDKALKYPMKKMWENQGEKVLYIKSMILHSDKKGETLIPRTLKERYEYLFGEKEIGNRADTVLRNLFQAIDVKNFGATFAEAGMNISITGAVQVGQGYNKYDDTEVLSQPILSPFRDSKASSKSENQEEAKSSTLGSKVICDEAHYFYPFCINPLAYKEYVALGVTEGYTEEDYKKFKHTAMVSATSFATNSKVGCENEFALFIETQPELYLPNMDQFITFIKGEGEEKNTIQISCAQVVEGMESQIHSMEVYYNPYTTNIWCDKKGVKLLNIFTQKEV